ncbi:hypothetical protein H6G80_05560 [Nostoc sp. FACHB-87]|uniref:HEPN domain-containing protein n=1 Tax=Nostocaceae TaxID=1162 RepID=UPI001684DCD3|nr:MULTISPECIES: HEPN domain-containing protein [Nostocaceae]MBD2453540.1 hypothetical protein [Nostoc sp. FACHB-87]MBD2475665.1 hypothetical protein [Anabaena sp. FACHB-83]
MKNREVMRAKQKLDNLFEKVNQLPDDNELKAHWARYLCILVSGFIENSVRAIYSQYAKNKAIPNIANFVERKLDDLQNPKMEKILQLTGAFSLQWESNLRKATEGELKDAIDSIVANRNNIAHGQDVGITYATIKDYYEKAFKVIQMIENQCNS